MTRALLIAAILVGTSSLAAAGPYAGLSIGPSASIYGTDSGKPPADIDEGGRSLRVVGGYRFRGASIEAALGGQTFAYKNNIRGLFDAKELALAGKYNYPLGYNFEVMAKAGLHRSWLSHQVDPVYDTAGTGLLLGFGAEYRVAVGPIKAGALTLDYTHHIATLEGDIYKFEKASIGVWMLGFTVGF